MADIGKTLRTIGLFLAGYLGIIIIDSIIPPLITGFETIFPSTEAQGIIWFITIIVWIALGLVLPTIKLIEALTTKEENDSKTINIMIAIIIFITMIFATIKLSGWFTIFANLSTTPIINIIFWIGAILTWLEITIITPAYLIIQSMND